ncbi:MAG: aminotransferase class V-fold PLP-dependent enzyme [Alphaproteobacteria bacterium]|nr:aminotransferase class V-fold PLP-dependent enzyme [Alphaproteobacteria bacterium]
MTVMRGRQFFQNPGPTNIPDRILRAMDRASMDFMGKEFAEIADFCFAGLKRVFKTKQTMFVYASNGHGAWEAAVVNLFSAGDKVLVLETGRFSASWGEMATAYGLQVETLNFDWRTGVEPAKVEERLKADTAREIRGVLLVHNETATGMTHPVADVRKAIDRAGHPALFLSDTISSLASIDFRMDEWKVDVAVGGSQKGLMLPIGMGFTGVSKKALDATQSATLPRAYFGWRLMLGRQPQKFPGTAPVHHFYGLAEAIRMLDEEGLDACFARHTKLGEATRAAVRAWGEGGGLQLYCSNPKLYSDSVTAILMAPGIDAEKVRIAALDRYNVSLGGGLDSLKGKVFRIGHMGDLNEPMLLGALACVEMALKTAGIPHKTGGVDAAMTVLAN